MTEKVGSSEYAEIKTELSALRGDINSLDTLVSRLDVAIDKISDVSTNINRLLAVHDNKLENHTRLIDQLTDSVDRRREEHDKKSQEILDKLTQLREDVRTSIHTSNIDLKKEISDSFNKKIEALETEVASQKKEVETLHRWKWLVTGGAVVVGWIISKLSVAISLL